jgi:hypothetical protein
VVVRSRYWVKVRGPGVVREGDYVAEELCDIEWIEG